MSGKNIGQYLEDSGGVRIIVVFVVIFNTMRDSVRIHIVI